MSNSSSCQLAIDFLVYVVLKQLSVPLHKHIHHSGIVADALGEWCPLLIGVYQVAEGEATEIGRKNNRYLLEV